MQKENNCNCQQLCNEMQKASLRKGVDFLMGYSRPATDIINALKGIYSVLESYDCLPAKCLLNRLKWVLDAIVPGPFRLSDSERINVEMLIRELNVFISK